MEIYIVHKKKQFSSVLLFYRPVQRNGKRRYEPDIETLFVVTCEELVGILIVGILKGTNPSSS
jgi:hypothetical protein